MFKNNSKTHVRQEKKKQTRLIGYVLSVTHEGSIYMYKVNVYLLTPPLLAWDL